VSCNIATSLTTHSGVRTNAAQAALGMKITTDVADVHF